MQTVLSAVDGVQPLRELGLRLHQVPQPTRGPAGLLGLPHHQAGQSAQAHHHQVLPDPGSPLAGVGIESARFPVLKFQQEADAPGRKVQLAQPLCSQDDPGVEIGAGVAGGRFLLRPEIALGSRSPGADPLAQAVGGVVVTADLEGGKDLGVVVQSRSAPGEFSLESLMAQEKGASAVSGLLESGSGVHGSVRLGSPKG